MAAACAVVAFTGIGVPAGAVTRPAVAVADESAAESTVDVRDLAPAATPTSLQRDAARALVAAAPAGARITWEPRYGTPRTVIPAAGATLTGPATGAPVTIARAWLTRNADVFGLSAADVRGLSVLRDHVLGTGTHTIAFAQTVAGVRAVHGGTMTVVVRRSGAVESFAGQVARSAALAGAWSLTPAVALQRVAGLSAPPAATGKRAGFTVFEKGPFAASSYVRPAVFATATGPRAAYQVLFVRALDDADDVLVDAVSGAVLYRQGLVEHEAEGRVYPNFPGAPKGGQPVLRSFGPNAQSPAGYVDPSGTTGVAGPTTFGNNANTYANYSNFEVPADQGPRPVSPTGKFDYAYGANWARTKGQIVPPSYVDDLNPAATNLFFQHNRVHDEFYSFGFTESAGNFQINNNGKGGMGGDAILGLVHAGAASGGAPTYTGRDNAYMLTLPDGIAPWSGMFLWEPINDAFESGYSDGNFDATVIEHEYAHGLSNRYVSAEDNSLSTHQSGSMGEGWGDWYGLNYLHRAGLYDKAVVGEYVTGNPARGIRNYAYDVNPTNYGDIGYDLTGPEVHADGEIWTTTLWAYRSALVKQFGQAIGSRVAALSITDAMPRSVANPSFVDMRNAIALAVDDRYHDSPNYERITDAFWSTFAQRGLGVHALTKGGDDTDPVPAFDHPDAARNGTLSGVVTNAATGKPVPGAKVIVGVYEARTTPLRVTSGTGAFAAPAVGGGYTLTVRAPGFGAQTFDGITVTPGKATALSLALTPNLASTANGATLVSAGGDNAAALLDDTEATGWSAAPRSAAVVKLATPAKISSVRISAFTTSRFEALKDFTLQVSDDGVNWRNALVRKGAFGFQAPRPVAPDVRYKTFTLATPTQASYVRFYADAPIGETKKAVQTAELQVLAAGVKGVQPLPPAPPDAPVTDKGTITGANPAPPNADGVTMTDLTTNCTAPPASQGVDGWVSTLPDSFGDGAHLVSVTGTSAAPHDVDLYFYNRKCQPTGSIGSSAPDESGSIPAGTKYVLTHQWSGANTAITLKAVDTQ